MNDSWKELSTQQMCGSITSLIYLYIFVNLHLHLSTDYILIIRKTQPTVFLQIYISLGVQMYNWGLQEPTTLDNIGSHDIIIDHQFN